MHADLLKTFIHDVPNYPKPGIIFKDISPLLASAKARHAATQLLAKPFQDYNIDVVIGIESRGFIFGLSLADSLNARFVMARKKGKLPGAIVSQEYALEYGTDVIEIQEMAIKPGDRVLIHDDVLATGGTAAAAIALVKKCGGIAVGASFLIELGFLNGRLACSCDHIQAVIHY